MGKGKGLSLFVTGALFGSLVGLAQKPERARFEEQPAVNRCLAASDVAIRLYYSPMTNGMGKYYAPCVFLPVSTQDPRLGTRPDLSLYVTLVDVKRVAKLLADFGLRWENSPQPAELIVEAPALPKPQHDAMEVIVTCPEGSAKAEVPPKRVCGLLSLISRELSGHKARDSFAFYQGSLNCGSDTASPGEPLRNDHE